MNKFVLRQSLLLLLTATIWGVAFVAQSVGMDYVGPFTFNAVRSHHWRCGTASMHCPFGKDKWKRQHGSCKKNGWQRAEDTFHWRYCLRCAYSVLQVICSSLGSCIHAVGKAGFITAMYIVVVPVLGIFFGKKVSA